MLVSKKYLPLNIIILLEFLEYLKKVGYETEKI